MERQTLSIRRSSFYGAVQPQNRDNGVTPGPHHAINQFRTVHRSPLSLMLTEPDASLKTVMPARRNTSIMLKSPHYNPRGDPALFRKRSDSCSIKAGLFNKCLKRIGLQQDVTRKSIRSSLGLGVFVVRRPSLNGIHEVMSWAIQDMANLMQAAKPEVIVGLVAKAELHNSNLMSHPPRGSTQPSTSELRHDKQGNPSCSKLILRLVDCCLEGADSGESAQPLDCPPQSSTVERVNLHAPGENFAPTKPSGTGVFRTFIARRFPILREWRAPVLSPGIWIARAEEGQELCDLSLNRSFSLHKSVFRKVFQRERFNPLLVGTEVLKRLTLSEVAPIGSLKIHPQRCWNSQHEIQLNGCLWSERSLCVDNLVDRLNRPAHPSSQFRLRHISLFKGLCQDLTRRDSPIPLIGASSVHGNPPLQ